MTDSLDERNRDPERFLYGVWPPMFELLQHMPPEHYAIRRLVDFLAEPEFTEQCEQDPEDYEKGSLQAFRDLLEADGICNLFDYSKVRSKTT